MTGDSRALRPGDAAVRGLIAFDMDGTLTLPQFDFDAIRAEIGLPAGPILEQLAGLSGERRAAAERILHHHEEQAARTSELQPRAAETVAAVHQSGFVTALLTRNSRASTAAFLARHDLSFDAVWTREDGPVKPAPDSMLMLCARFDVTPARSWIVGDYLFDLQCGRRAGGRAILLLTQAVPPPWAHLADFVIRSLDAVPQIVQSA